MVYAGPNPKTGLMLPLESSPDVLAEIGSALETLADGIRGSIGVAREQTVEVILGPAWASSASLWVAIDDAEARADAIAEALMVIRQAIQQASEGYAAADRRSAARHGAIRW